MNENSNILLLLLKHHTGQLSNQQETALNDLLESDGRTKVIWKQLQTALRETGNIDSSRSRDLDEAKFSSEFSAETIAAFVEGRLSEGSAEKVSQVCLENSDLMQQIASCSCFHSVTIYLATQIDMGTIN